MSVSFTPAYQKLGGVEVRRRAEEALARLADCTLCPRACHADRAGGKEGVCAIGRYARVSSYGPHHGEEDCLRGTRGSGTIFFAGCNLHCVFCQNYDISWLKDGKQTTAAELAAMMLRLQELECHNLNLVSPSHVVAQILEALALAIDQGLRLPIVYNTSGYDSANALRLMDGIVDIYMPDFKFWAGAASQRYCRAPDYPECARAAIKEMHRQVGFLRFDRTGLAQRGLLMRHLVMPGNVAGTADVMRWVARELGPESYVNVMSQYYPAGKVCGKGYDEISRTVTREEFAAAHRAARNAGLTRLDERLH